MNEEWKVKPDQRKLVLGDKILIGNIGMHACSVKKKSKMTTGNNTRVPAGS